MMSVALFKGHPQEISGANERFCRLRKPSCGYLLFCLLLFATRLLLRLWLKQRGIFAVAFFL